MRQIFFRDTYASVLDFKFTKRIVILDTNIDSAVVVTVFDCIIKQVDQHTLEPFFNRIKRLNSAKL